MRYERRAELVQLGEAMRAAANYRPDPDWTPVVLALPFRAPGWPRTAPHDGYPVTAPTFSGKALRLTSPRWNSLGALLPCRTGEPLSLQNR